MDEASAERAGTSGPATDDAADEAAEFVPVARVEQLPEGTLLGVTTPDGTPVCLVNRDGELYAIHDVCTHQAFPLSAGELLPDGTVECSWHGATFDPCSGEACRGPACDSVRTYELRVADGMILVRSSPPRLGQLGRRAAGGD